VRPRFFHILLAALAAVACAGALGVAREGGEAPCRSVIPEPRAISWRSPSNPRDQHALADWCAAVGPILYEPVPSPLESHTLDRVAIVSWNTHVGGGDLDSLLARVHRGDFTNGEPFDEVVLMLQEVYRHGDDVPRHLTIHAAIPGRILTGSHAEHRYDVRRFARERGMAVLYAPSMRNGFAHDDPEDRGNAILATLPLGDATVIELPIERQRRVVAIATISGQTSLGEPWRLKLANVHLDTALALTRGGPLGARRRQAEALIADLPADSDADATILAGDFNTWMGHREPAIAALQRAFPAVPFGEYGATWSGPLGLRATLDHVFARGRVGSIHVTKLPSRFGSDHYPLLAVVRF
jgi:endonuclease/exonuclease/phosphatase family metal-dependent hydrolase